MDSRYADVLIRMIGNVIDNTIIKSAAKMRQRFVDLGMYICLSVKSWKISTNLNHHHFAVVFRKHNCSSTEKEPWRAFPKPGHVDHSTETKEK